MSYQVVAACRQEHAVAVVCRALGVSRSGYYQWHEQAESVRSQENQRLLAEIRVIHRQVDRCYGSPRMTAELCARGLACGEHRVARLMRRAGIKAKAPRRFRVTTESTHALPVAPNLLARQFRVDQPNAVWASDITSLWTAEGWVYLAVVMDLHSRLVVGWATGSQITAELTLAALQRALQRRVAGGMHHSDRGKQYAAQRYQQVLADHGITCSMSRRGNCWDNAVVESFFASLKKEAVHDRPLSSRREAQTRLFDYIERFYNGVRRHSTLGQRSPREFEASRT